MSSSWMDNVNRIKNAKSDIANAIKSKGIDIPEGVKIDEYHKYIDPINAWDLGFCARAYNNDELLSLAYNPTGNFSSAFYGYTGKIDRIEIGNNVTDMSYTYYNCINLTGSPVCGENVTNMSNTYSNCRNLTGSPVCGNNVTNMSYAYNGCFNITGNGYFYSNNILDVMRCFYGRNTSNRLNLYVPVNSNTQTSCLYNNMSSLIGSAIEWTNDYTNNGVYYNTSYNLYIYPVNNVAETRLNNGD